MAEPLHCIWQKGCVILSAVLRSSSSRLSRRNSSLLLDQIIQCKKSSTIETTKVSKNYWNLCHIHGVWWYIMSDDLIVHDFLRDTLVSTYKECIYCKGRTQFTCAKCRYCYSCHWKKEELDRAQLKTLATTANSANLGKYSQAATTRIIGQSPTTPAPYQQLRGQQQEKAVDVYGQETEPICSYLTCQYKFSLHSVRSCRCRHALNYASGVSLKTHCMKYD
jgi:hypothetical protein